MSTSTRIWGALVIVVIIAIGVWYFTRTPNPFPVSASDNLSSWALPLPQNAASSTPTLTAQITQLSKMIGGGAYPDADIYIGIANDYMLTGNGMAAYQSYERAIEASSSDALTYDDLGGLFARLYATSTALRAYNQAVILDPSQLLFQLSYLDYLAEVAPNASSTESAFTSAKAVIGASNPNLLIAEANWLAAIGSTTAAIADWEAARAQTPAAQQSAIDANIAKLQKK